MNTPGGIIAAAALACVLSAGCQGTESGSPAFAPSLYDCTAAGPLPARRSPVPLSCVVDTQCSGRRMVVGHRGVGGEYGRIAPEDSLSGIRAAIWMGVDGIEIDARDTADGGLVVMHDSSTLRTTGVDATVEAMTAAEVTALPLLAPPGAEGDFSCDRVPALSQALDLARNRIFITLDTKTSRVDLVIAAIAGAGMTDQVIISVSDPARAVAARALDPGIRVQVRPDTITDATTDLSLFSRPPEIFEIPWEIGPGVRAAIGPEPKIFANVFNEDIHSAVNNRTGKKDAAHYLPVFENGVDIVQTEFPAIVLRLLGRWPFSSDPWSTVPTQ